MIRAVHGNPRGVLAPIMLDSPLPALTEVDRAHVAGDEGAILDEPLIACLAIDHGPLAPGHVFEEAVADRHPRRREQAGRRYLDPLALVGSVIGVGRVREVPEVAASDCEIIRCRRRLIPATIAPPPLRPLAIRRRPRTKRSRALEKAEGDLAEVRPLVRCDAVAPGEIGRPAVVGEPAAQNLVSLPAEIDAVQDVPGEVQPMHPNMRAA